MKIYLSSVFLFITIFSLSQSEINAPAPIIDTMRTDFQGDWYLSGITYYSCSDESNSDFYKPAKESCHIRITQDSIIFYSPPERFYRTIPQGYKYETTDFHPYHGCEIVTYLENKKNRSNIAKFTIKYNGSDLRLVESLQSDVFGEINIVSCSIYKAYIDSVHLEQKLLGAWNQGRLRYSKIKDETIELQDTINLYKSSCQQEFASGIQFFFEFVDGSLMGEIEESYSVHSPEDKSSKNSVQGIIDGVYITGHKCVCQVFPDTNILVMQNEFIQYTFSIILCIENELKMVLLNKETKTQDNWR